MRLVVLLAAVVTSGCEPQTVFPAGHNPTVFVSQEDQVDEVLAEGALIAKTSLPEALQHYRAAFARVDPQSPAALRFLGATASVLRQLRRHDDAFEAHEAAMRVKGTAGATKESFLASYVELAQDRYYGFRYDEAITVIKAARSNMASVLTDEMSSLLLKVESFVHTCLGDYGKAAELLETARGVPALSPGDARDDATRLRLLLQYRRLSERPTSRSAKARRQHNQIVAALAEREDKLDAWLLAHGPWNATLQMPHHYVPELGPDAAPWIDEPGQLAALISILERSASALRAEAEQLTAQRRLWRDQDCIADPRGGAWLRYEITGLLNDPKASDGCSVHTPVACTVLEELRATAVATVLRAGYSILEPRTWLKPHFGSTNAQLKLHLGLVVPTNFAADEESSASLCATMRVGRDTRAWSEGHVLMFDDSFEHEVHNRCNANRVVFQVVVRHPALPPPPQNYRSVVIDGH